jgi:hypothetical protein
VAAEARLDQEERPAVETLIRLAATEQPDLEEREEPAVLAEVR